MNLSFEFDGRMSNLTYKDWVLLWSVDELQLIALLVRYKIVLHLRHAWHQSWVYFLEHYLEDYELIQFKLELL